VMGALFLVIALALLDPYATSLSADAETARLARSYLLWFIPAMGLQFPLVAMGSALRAIGNFKTGMIVGSATVILNIVLAPFLIFGWVTGHPFGVAGAAISTMVAIIVGLVWFAAYFLPKHAYLHISHHDWRPEPGRWRRMLAVGLPTGFEFGMMALYMALVYALARPFGAAAQAGFGIGQRIIQTGFMPVVALGFAVAPVAGQNFGARSADRVRATFKDAALLATAVMVAFSIASHVAPAALVGIFSSDPAVIDVGVGYLKIIAWNYVASGIVFVSSSMFQAMGNTIPSVIASGTRLLIVAVPALILSSRADFQLVWVWYLSMLAVWIQLGLALLLLRREFRNRLSFGAGGPVGENLPG
jgi:putative MATE family efflux protein